MNAEYWIEEDGQLEPGERADRGFRHKDDADRYAATISGAVVRRLQTVESDYPIEDPRWEPFKSARWCVIVRK